MYFDDINLYEIEIEEYEIFENVAVGRIGKIGIAKKRKY